MASFQRALVFGLSVCFALGTVRGQTAAPGGEEGGLTGQEVPGMGSVPGGEGQEQLFGPGRTLELSLEAAMRVAVVNDLGLKIQETQTEVAMFNARGSWGSFDWVFSATAGVDNSKVKARTELEGAPVPTTDSQSASFDFTRPLEWGGSFSVNFNRENVKTNNQFVTINPSTTDVFQVGYTQPLLRGLGWDYGTSEQQLAEIQYQFERERQREAQQDLLLAVANAYWDLVLAIQQLDVVGSSLALALEQLERDTRVYEAGLGTEVDVLQAEARVAQNSELLLLADVNVKAGEDALKQLLFPGTDTDTWDTHVVPITPLPERVSAQGLPPWSNTLSVALDYRPEVRQRQLEISSAEINYEQAVNERRPALDLNLSARGQGFSGDPQTAFKEALGFDFPTYVASLSFGTPLQNRTRRNLVKSARAQVRGAKLAYDQTQSQIVAEVREALRQLRYQAEAVTAAVRSVEASRRQLEAEQARNREGISTNFQVLEFQDQYVQALDSERRARVNFMRAQAAYMAAKGVLGEGIE